MPKTEACTFQGSLLMCVGRESPAGGLQALCPRVHITKAGSEYIFLGGEGDERLGIAKRTRARARV